MVTVYIPTVERHLRRRRKHIGRNKDILYGIDHVESVAVIGSSCAGKSRLVDELRKGRLAKQGAIDISPRFTTRRQRENDNTVENVFLTDDEFDAKKKSGHIDLTWERHLPSGVVRYGFAPRKPDAELAVYPANNAFYYRGTERQCEGMIFMEVMAPYQVRADRLAARSPDLTPLEIESRLADHTYLVHGEPLPWMFSVGDAFPFSSDYCPVPHGFFDSRFGGHLRIFNFGSHEAEAPGSFVYFIESLAEIQNPSLIKGNPEIVYVPDPW